jgi:putative oxygen-independent coproporphyrinogen III oxidase
MTALYIHWPFCKKKCPYCDFNSHVRDAVDYERMGNALVRELRTMHAMAHTHALTSIFFGGGTPSLMPARIVQSVIDTALELWNSTDNIEITLEANPTSFEAQNFKDYKSAGVNRLSLGVQSLIDEELRFLGREHSAHEALLVLEQVQQLFSRYSIDLIYARPHQTLKAWEQELQQALRYHAGHMSLYQLTIEPDTNFARVYAKGGFALPDDDTALALYELTQTLCAEAGLQRYEVSNYASAGQESIHNLSYWRGDDYIGVGAGAHGRILTHAGQWVATSTHKSPERWLSAVEADGHALVEQRMLSAEDRAEEMLISGLRLAEGIACAEVQQVINPDKMQFFIAEGLVRMQQERLAIPPKHIGVTERIIAELLM